jgi:hypothetical protein
MSDHNILSKREQIAALVLSGIASLPEPTPGAHVARALELADQLIFATLQSNQRSGGST